MRGWTAPNYLAALAAYLADCARRGLRAATIRYYAMVLERVGAECELGSPGDLSLARIRAFQDRPGRLGPGSLRGFLRATKTFSRWLVDHTGKVPAGPGQWHQGCRQKAVAREETL